MQATVKVLNFELSFSDADVVNPDEFVSAENSNRYSARPWLLHDHGTCLAVVFADCLQDALDIAADAGKLDRYLIEEEGNTPGIKGLPAEDYPTLGTDNEEGIARLGNASEPFDIESLGYVELSTPAFSFAALWMAAHLESAAIRSYHFA